MHTRAIRATLFAVALAVLSSTGVAAAAPIELTVRIEGEDRTLFEGPILTDGHDVRAASDKATRPCDGTNNGANPDPGPTPTAATVDAMAIAGEGFDAKWFPGYDDYYVERWGPDAEDLGAGAFWGLLVDGTFTPVGGCQFRSEAGEEVLWAYDAFSSKPFLRLAAAADPSPPPGPASPTASVEQGEPLTLSVKSSTGAMGAGANIQPVATAVVAPVATDPVKGFQEVKTSDPSAVTTVADGTVPVTFSTPGWHRLKAVKSGHIRSNRLDVCVEPSGGGDCGQLPPDAQVRIPPASPGLPEPPPPEPGATAGQIAASGPAASPSGSPVQPSSISFGRLKMNREAGSALIAISVSGPGLLTLSGNKVRKQSVRASTAGRVTLAVKAKGKALTQLRETGKVTVAVTTVFTPVQGAAATARKSVVLKLGEPAR
jgi:hypothetical protein